MLRLEQGARRSAVYPGGNEQFPTASTEDAPSDTAARLPSPLVRYGLAGLRRCWMPEHGRWSHRYWLDGRAEPNESVPHSDLYYSMNVLLGLARTGRALADEPYDAPIVLEAICRAAADQPMRNGCWGMALWAAAELDVAPPTVAADRLQAHGRDLPRLAGWTTQDLGLSLSGACAQGGRDPSWWTLAHGLRDLLVMRFRGPGALFRDSGRGARRHFATFATQVYAGIALYQYGALFEDEAASGLADAIVRKLLDLQGPRGEWPWLYSPDADRVLDPYEVYSVHQHGMGPALLHHAVVRGVPGARDGLERGFHWVFGCNLLRRSMLVRELQLIYRSQARRGLASSRRARAVRGVASILTGHGFWPQDAARLRLTPEMRSYELGWLLWSFAGRDDYPNLTDNPAFLPVA